MKEFTKNNPITSFLISTFVLTWIVGIISIIILQIVERVIGLENGTISNTLARYGPTFGAMLTLYYLNGKTGVKELLLRGIKWKVGIAPYLYSLIGPPLVIIISLIINDRLITSDIFDISILFSLITIFITKLFFGGGFSEEFGWRGFMLPQLNKKYNHLISSFIVGVVWVAWHIPAYFIGNKSAEDPILPFTIQVIALSYIFSWLYYKSKQSVLIVAITHAMANASLTIIENLYSETVWYKELYLDYYWGLTLITVALAVTIILSGFIFKKELE